ncbi:MAG: DNA alkylation repair protein [Oscillospiraceae bacterium]|nr:DNA alkylation repair protein [Oscillospiraceae bacterium]
MITDEIRKELAALRDETYREFQAKLIPTADPDSFIGVRTPALRSYARQLVKREDIGEFLDDLPHRYFDENQLHAFIISLIRDYDSCMTRVCAFLPYVDNWATCDQMSPKVFKKHGPELRKQIERWLCSSHTYTVRFAVGMLMEHFLDEAFDPAYPAMVAAIRSDEYYINMMIAWYFATALAKQYDTVLPYLEEKKLAVWTHNRTIQKAVESYRITPEKKEYLRSLKIAGSRQNKTKENA